MCVVTQWRFQRSGSRLSWLASHAVGWSKVKRLRMALPSSKTTMVGALFTLRTTIVSWRRVNRARAVASPAAVPTRTVTGLGQAAGVEQRMAVLAAVGE